MRVKGRYAATITVDIDYDDEDKALLPYEDAKYAFSGKDIQNSIQYNFLKNVFDGMQCKVTVFEQYKDLYLLPEDVDVKT